MANASLLADDASPSTLIARPDSNVQARLSVDDVLDVRRFRVTEHMSTLFDIDIVAHCQNPSLPFESIVGRPATFELLASRTWEGICSRLELVSVAEGGYSTYHVRIAPTLWLTTQRRNYRIFQQMSEPQIVTALLGEWGIRHDLRIDPGRHKKRDYRVQYGESDYAFICRMLEDAGIAFFFEDGGQLVLSDAPQSASPRAPLSFRVRSDRPTTRPYAVDVTIAQRVRPGRYVVQGLDYRRQPENQLASQAGISDPVEARLERFHYVPGAFLFGGDADGTTPSADDRGATRHAPKDAAEVAQKRLEAKRAGTRQVSFTTNLHELCPGTVVSIEGHPNQVLADGGPLLVLGTDVSGTHHEWTHRCEAVSARAAYRPPLSTPKPKVHGVESATVVGPPGEEIHTDEFGRVRVHFHWDRYNPMDQTSSCWIPVSQAWAGTGFGGINLPRIGQEVIIDFLGGDPDEPVVVGRVYTTPQPVPYGLPGNKTQSGWRSMSTPGGGGYNEILFEDAKGAELVNMQAERDMQTLVKNDQRLTVRNDRTKAVVNDETTTIGNDRTETVGNDEKITIGNDRTEAVGNDEKITIGNDRTEAVANDEKITIGNDRTLLVQNDETTTVGNDQTITIGNDRTLLVQNDENILVGNDQATVVVADQSEHVGQNRSRTVGAVENVLVGGDQSIAVQGSQSTKVGKDQSVAVAANQSTTVGSLPTGQGRKVSERTGGAHQGHPGRRRLQHHGRRRHEHHRRGAERGAGRAHEEPEGRGADRHHLRRFAVDHGGQRQDHPQGDRDPDRGHEGQGGGRPHRAELRSAMKLVNHTPWPHLLFERRDTHNRAFVVLALQGTFGIDVGKPLRALPEQEPVLVGIAIAAIPLAPARVARERPRPSSRAATSTSTPSPAPPRASLARSGRFASASEGSRET
jgi:type VI secretion system secreted protein VgrG